MPIIHQVLADFAEHGVTLTEVERVHAPVERMEHADNTQYTEKERQAT